MKYKSLIIISLTLIALCSIIALILGVEPAALRAVSNIVVALVQVLVGL